MAGADWSISLGFVIFLVALIVSIIYYLRYKKIYLVSLILSIAVYTFSVFYTWDVFELNKNGVLLLLIVSTIIMLFLGKYTSNFQLKPEKPKTSLKEK